MYLLILCNLAKSLGHYIFPDLDQIQCLFRSFSEWLHTLLSCQDWPGIDNRFCNYLDLEHGNRGNFSNFYTNYSHYRLVWIRLRLHK